MLSVATWVYMDVTPKWPGPILDTEGMGAFFGGHFSKKKALCLLAPPKQMPFLIISNGNIFFKTQGARLGAIVASNKGLE